MLKKLNFKGKYFRDTKEAVHVKDADVQRMIDEVVQSLIDGTSYAYQITGDTIVIGIRFDTDNEISVFVSQNYDTAILLTEDNGRTWEPIDWKYEEDKDVLCDLSKDELITQILDLQDKLRIERESNRPVYNPHREV